MNSIPIWEQILAGAIALLVLLWFAPGIKRLFEESRRTESRDWLGFILPIVLVALFVIAIIALM